ncbi:MAG TPA: radical SAM protein [Chloroflexota bacterium]|jgi:radical SAM superfamily enzyme YgiQ (UPF0313 family)|nr:radical SAM protein [Chloroflexota bacterium]
MALKTEQQRKRILLINPLPSLSLYSWPDVRDITGHPAYIMNIALPTLAALCPPQIDITVVDEAVEPVSFDGEWDLVGITGYLTQMRRMCEIADEFRRRGQLVAIGGPYASLSPHVVRPHADILFIGEAEATWPTFLEDFLSGHWQTEYHASDLIDLQTSPIPDLHTLRPRGYELGVVQTSRGCPFECEFCDVIVYLGRKQRHKSPDRVIAELDQMYAHGYRSIFLSDDNFTANRQRAADTMRAVREWNRANPEPVVLYTQLSIDVTRDRDLPLLDLCAEAGLKQAFVGIETPNTDSLREVKKRQNLRTDLVADVHRIQSRGIMVQAGMITGFDADTLDTFALMLEFLQEAGIPMVLLAMLNALDGTPLQARLAAENRLKPILLADAALDTNVIPRQMSSQELLKGTVWLLNQLYAPRNFLRRLNVFASQLPSIANSPSPSSPRDDVAFWERVAVSYSTLGPDLRDVPLQAARMFHGRDTHGLRTALIFYRSAVAVLRRWGIWDPRQAELSRPAFSRTLEPVG